MRAQDITTHGHEGAHACIGELSHTLEDIITPAMITSLHMPRRQRWPTIKKNNQMNVLIENPIGYGSTICVHLEKCLEGHSAEQLNC